MGKNGLVTSAHPLATQAGLQVLLEGGNACEAAITISAVLGVVRSHLSGIGGDLFILLYSAQDKQYLALNASGRSPLAASINRITGLGCRHMPRRGILSVTVPGCVSGWDELWQKYGKISLSRLLQPAIDYANQGFALGYHSWETLDNLRDIIRNDPGLRERYLPQGKPLKPGDVLVQRDLAATLEAIAVNGPAWFYRGKTAEQIAAYLLQKGGLLGKEDLALHTAGWEEPLATAYGSYRLHQTPPNSQGLAALLAFNIIESLDFTALGCDSPQCIHYLVEVKKIACQYRDHYITDPEFVPVVYEELLDKQFAARLLKMIIPGQAGGTREHRPNYCQSDCFIVADREGNIAAGTQSLYSPLGAGFIVPETGIILQNSGSAYSLDPEHINRLEPQKRPFHVLTPTIASYDNQPILALGVSGGDCQLQVQLQLICQVLNGGINVQEALERPRWLHGGTYPDDPFCHFQAEGRFSVDQIGELESWGHSVRVIDDWAGQAGEAQAVRIDSHNRVYQAGVDPRSEATAAAY